MKDIATREDIHILIEAFYEKVRADDTIGFIFNEVVHMDWPKHIPVIVDFWETILLDHPVYTTNAMEVHYQLNQHTPLLPQHFDRWVALFTGTVDALYTGAIAELAKKRAQSIAAVMAFKMNAAGNGRSII